MFEISFSELIVIAIVALIVIKPEDLPEILRSVGKALGKVKKMAREFTSLAEEVTKDTGIEDLKKITGLDGKIYQAYNVEDLKNLIADKEKPKN